MSVTVSFTGGRELDTALRALGNPAAARRAGRAALEPEAEFIRLAAVALAPDDPATAGNLKAAIQKKSSTRGDVVQVRIGINAEVDPATAKARKSGKGTYRDPGVAGNAVIQEFGTPKMAPNPFMRPAWDAAKSGLIAKIGNRLWPEIERQAARLAKARAKL